jgi:hypothetical protein
MLRGNESACLAWAIIGTILGHDPDHITDQEWREIYQKASEASRHLSDTIEELRERVDAPR